MVLKRSSYPFDWVRPEQCIKPLGPFGRTKFFQLLRAGAFQTKSLSVGHGERPMTLISVDSVNAFLAGAGLAVGPAPRKPKHASAGGKRKTSNLNITMTKAKAHAL